MEIEMEDEVQIIGEQQQREDIEEDDEAEIVDELNDHEGPSVANPEEGSCPSPAKSRKIMEDDDDEDGYLCTICYCPFTNSGEHRLSCLACGHIFGESCIHRWLKTAGTCPQCNGRARKRDVRVLYVKQLQAMDTAERDRALQDLEEKKKELANAKLEIAKLTIKSTKDNEEMARLKEEVKTYQIMIKELESVIQSSASGGGTPMKAALDSLKNNPSSKFYTGDGIIRGDKNMFYTAHGRQVWQGEECRVGAFSEWSNAFVVSQKFKKLPTSNLFKSLGGFGVRIFNWGDPKKVVNMPVHQKEIRDVAFSPSQTDLLLTVGMDCRACLTNIHTQLQVLTFTTESPIWSCAFNQTDPNIIYFGMGNGQIVAYDIRKPKEIMDTLSFQSDKTPVSRLHFVPPSYQQSGFSSAGLLVQKLQTCWLVEHSANVEPVFHQLPFDGGFLGVDFEPLSRHLLVSTRPSASNPSRHMVCEMTRHSYEGSGTAFGCNVMKTYTGGAMMGKLYRPKIFAPEENKVFVAASKSHTEVDMWDISETNVKQTFRVPGIVLDYVPVKYNDTHFMTFLTSDSLEVYKY